MTFSVFDRLAADAQAWVWVLSGTVVGMGGFLAVTEIKVASIL